MRDSKNGINPQYVVLFHYFRLFLFRAAEQEIDVAPLKGAHLLTSVYPEGEDRGVLADVDFLVRERDWGRAKAILFEMGFEKRPPTSRPVSDEMYHETAFYLDVGKDARIMFEMHRCLAPKARLKIDYESLWRRSEASLFDGAPCRRLLGNDHFLHAVVHLVSHSFIAPERALRDLSLLVQRGGVSIDVVVSRAGEWGVKRACWLVLMLLGDRMPEVIEEAHLARVRPHGPVRRGLRWLVPSGAGFRFPTLGLRGQQIVLWPLLFDSSALYLIYSASYLNLRRRDAIAWFRQRRK